MNRTIDTILVTGGCGYLGSRLIRDLAQDDQLGGTTIRILDNLQQGQHRALMDLPPSGRYQFIEGDILDPTVLGLALDGVDTVIHLAAVVRTPFSFENPVWMDQVNHWGTAHLVEACLRADVRHLIFASSAAVYGPGGPYEEEDVCRPQGPYAQSKLAAEKNVLAALERGLHVTILRLGTLYGLAPVMRFDALVNRFAYLTGVCRPLTVFGDGRQRRPILHVNDASAAFRHAIVRSLPAPVPVYNVVEASVSVLDVVEAARQSRPELTVHYTEQDIRTHYSFDVVGARFRSTGWQPRASLAEGFTEMLEHFAGFTQFKVDADIHAANR